MYGVYISNQPKNYYFVYNYKILKIICFHDGDFLFPSYNNTVSRMKRKIKEGYKNLRIGKINTHEISKCYFLRYYKKKPHEKTFYRNILKEEEVIEILYNKIKDRYETREIFNTLTKNYYFEFKHHFNKNINYFYSCDFYETFEHMIFHTNRKFWWCSDLKELYEHHLESKNEHSKKAFLNLLYKNLDVLANSEKEEFLFYEEID